MSEVVSMWQVEQLPEPEAAPGSFEHAWNIVKPIKGWLSMSEARALWEAAQKTPADGLIVEIGSHRGRSTTLLAETGRHVTAVDPLVISDDATAFAIQMASYGKFRWVRSPSCDVDINDIRFPAIINLLYIDADHIAPNPVNDFRHFQPNLRRGSAVVFHDYNSEPDVTLAVDELEIEGTIRRRDLVGSMYIGEFIK